MVYTHLSFLQQLMTLSLSIHHILSALGICYPSVLTNISTIIQTGLNTVPRVEPTQLTTELVSYNCLTLRTGAGSNPHNLETGTPTDWLHVLVR